MLAMPVWTAGELCAERPWPGVGTLGLCMEASAFLVCASNSGGLGKPLKEAATVTAIVSHLLCHACRSVLDNNIPWVRVHKLNNFDDQKYSWGAGRQSKTHRVTRNKSSWVTAHHGGTSQRLTYSPLAFRQSEEIHSFNFSD